MKRAGITMKSFANLRKQIMVTMASGMALLLFGCQSFIDSQLMPRHPKSAYIENEEVTITPITYANMKDFCLGDDKLSFESQYLKTFEQELKDDEFNTTTVPHVEITQFKEDRDRAIPAPAIIAGEAILSVAAEYAKKQMEKEAERYEASFDTEASRSRFYNNVKTNVKSNNDDKQESHTHSITQNVYGLKIERQASYKKGEAPVPCYTLYVGFYISPENRLMKVAPIYFHTEHSKAKVLKMKDAWRMAIIWSLLLKQTDDIYTKTQIALDSTYSNSKQETSTVNLGPPINIELKKYNITNHKDEFFNNDNSKSGWVSAPLITESLSAEHGLSGSGTYHVTVNVVEKDLSNTKKYLKEGASQVKAMSQKAVGLMKKQQ